jgi:hypothetical protein
MKPVLLIVTACVVALAALAMPVEAAKGGGKAGKSQHNTIKTSGSGLGKGTTIQTSGNGNNNTIRVTNRVKKVGKVPGSGGKKGPGTGEGNGMGGGKHHKNGKGTKGTHPPPRIPSTRSSTARASETPS